MSDRAPSLADLPTSSLHHFVGRSVRCSHGPISNRTGDKSWATLVSIISSTHAIVKPVGHQKTEKVELRYIHPWFSRNPDLRYLFTSPSTLPYDEEDLPESEPQPEPLPASTIETKPPADSNPYSSLSDLLNRAASLKTKIDQLTEYRQSLLSQLKSNDDALTEAQSSLLSLRKDVQAATSLINDIIPSSPSRSSSNKESSYTPLKQAILDVTLPGQVYPVTAIGERIVAHDPSFCSTTDPSDRNFRNLCTSVSWHLNRSPSHFHREARGLFRRL